MPATKAHYAAHVSIWLSSSGRHPICLLVYTGAVGPTYPRLSPPLQHSYSQMLTHSSLVCAVHETTLPSHPHSPARASACGCMARHDTNTVGGRWAMVVLPEGLSESWSGLCCATDPNARHFELVVMQSVRLQRGLYFHLRYCWWGVGVPHVCGPSPPPFLAELC